MRGKPFRQGVGIAREREQMSLELLLSVTWDLEICTAPKPNGIAVPILSVSVKESGAASVTQHRIRTQI